MGIILCKLANTKKTVQSAAHFMSVHKTKLKHAHRQFSVAMQCIIVHQKVTDAVHRFYAMDSIFNFSKIHILAVMVIVT